MKKLLFKIRHRKMKKHSFPFKLYVDQSAARFSHFLAKKEGKKLIRAEYLAEECKDLKNQIDDYGKEGSPEDPPYAAEEYEEIKRTVRVNTL